MRKLFLSMLLFAATTIFAEVKVESFTTENGSVTSGYYMAEPTTLQCAQASWTVLGGGIKKNVGNMGAENFCALFRAKRTDDTFEGLPYIMSDSIEGGIDSLWFTWNSNGKETGKTWNVHIYVNDVEVGAITEAGAAQIAAGGPFNTFSVGNLQVPGKFVIKLVNEFDPAVAKTSNVMRMVIDDLSWATIAAAGEKITPTASFAEKSLLKKVDVLAFMNPFTTNSDGQVSYQSSDPQVATVGENGTVTVVGIGTTTITASVAESDTYKTAEASYTVRIVPLNFHLETFDGAVNATGNATYLTNDSVTPMSDAGIVWTTHLGSVRDNLGGGSLFATNVAVAIRAKKTSETAYGYLLSSTIEGGIDSLAFDWTCNGTEASRQHPWNIAVYINGDSVGAITDACTAIPSAPYRFSIGNLKKGGDFTIRIVNLNDADDGKSNHYRWVMDNLEWYSYEDTTPPCETSYGIMMGENYVAGVLNTEASYTEYSIVADMEAGQAFTLYDYCAGVGFLAAQEEGGYWFNVENNQFVAPATGTYSIYLKMYGYDNNVIWTSFEAPVVPPTPVDSVTYYAVNTIGLTAPYAYVWDSVGAAYVEWPGVAMTPINQEFRGYPIYAVTVPANMTNMVISENGSEYIKTQDMDINPATPYMYLMEWYASLDDVPAECSQTFGILVGENFIAGRQTEASQYLEYMIVAELAQGDHLKFYENCTKSAFAVAQEEGGYWFTYDQASDDYVAPATGTYTIYLKLYGVDNNVIWTSFEAPIVSEWDEITFSDNIPVADFTAEQIFYSPNRSLTLHAYNGSSKMAVDENQCRFGLEDDFTVYTHRIKTGAKSKDNVHYMTLNVAADGLLRIAVRSASSTATDRTLLVKQNDSILLERIPTDNDSVMTPVGKSFPYSVMPVKQGTVVISFPVGALNFYSFGFKEGEMPVPPTPVDSVTYYAVNTIGLTAPYAYVWDSVGGEYVAWPGVPMQPINEEFRGYPIYAVTVPANMTGMVISENGNQAMKTKDMALDPAKPYMYLMLWYASLDEIPGECTQSFGILVGNRFIAGELNESASYMEYIIKAELNANDQIKFYESCTQSDFFVNQEEGGWWFTLDRENEVYIVPDTGTYTIYLKLYAFDNRAIYTIYQAPVVPPAPAHYYIAGTMTDWRMVELLSDGSSPEMVALIPMEADTLDHFKVVCILGTDTTWYGNTGTMEYYNCTNWVFDDKDYAEAGIHTTEAGNYVFVVTINEQGLPVVSVQIPTPSTVEMVTYYAVNSIGIQIPYAYVWNADGAYVQWPGVPMQPINEEFRGYPIYAVTVPVTMDSMVINANGSDQLKTPDMALDTLKPYMYNLVWYASLSEIPEECSTTFGILVNGENFIPGALNEGQQQYREYAITADLQAGDQFVLYEYCTESPFMAAQEEGGWWFNIVENHFVANTSANFTIYLKIYGYDNNVIYTVNNSGSGLEETLYNDGQLHKVVEDGIIVIYRNGKRYNLQGQEL